MLPAAVGAMLASLEGRLGQFADPQARQHLAELGEEGALRVLRMIGESRTGARNLSAYIVSMAKKERTERNARSIPIAESVVFGSVPFRGEDSVLGLMYHDGARMEVDTPNGGIEVESAPAHQVSFGLQNHESPLRAVASMAHNQDGMEVENPTGWFPSGSQNAIPIEVDPHVPAMAHTVPDHAMMQVGSPGRCGLSGLQHQVGVKNPVRQTILTPLMVDSTPSPVRDITKRVQRMGGPSGMVGVETPQTLECMTQAEPLVTADALRATVSPQMLALGELEFIQVFLIHVYLAGNKIEDVSALHEDYIRSLKSLPMDCFESEIWNKFGHKFVASSDRRKHLDWDPSKMRVYHCIIEKRDDSIVTVFKGPYIENTRTHLQKVVGDDNVLVVKFSDIPGHTNTGDNFGTYCNFYHPVAENGIILGLRHYRFLIYKDGGKEKRKEEKKKERNRKCTSSVRCYFVRTESGWDRDVSYPLSNKTIDQARKLFMHIHTAPTVAKYLARFALILSKTITLDVDFSTVNIITIDDEPCKDENGNIVCNDDGEALIHTDGTGLISEDLARKCPTNVFKGNFLKTHDLQRLQDIVDSKRNHYGIAEHPLLMQFRMFYNGSAVKGTVLVDKRLPPKTIHIRPSMIKVKADPNLLCDQSFNNSLEIVTTSNRPKKALTSRFLIALLCYGGVPQEYFMELLGKALEDVESARHKTSDCLEVAFNHADMDDSMSARMILSGIKPEDDAYLESQLALMTKEERKGIKQGKLPIDECYYLMGTTDPTGKLKPCEVCVILEHGQLSGDVLVYKHPGLHFGDIHVLKATYIDELEEIVGNSKYAIFFPTSGPRSLADEMANSDFDGDMYWVSRNPQLLKHFKPSEPWYQRIAPKKTEQKNPQDFDGSQLERLLFCEFLRTTFTPSYVLGTAADCWLALMDRLLTPEVHTSESEKEAIKTKMLELVDIYYLALDAPKTGNKINVRDDLMIKTFPHFMERKASYNSTSVLGKIYDEAMSHQSENVPPIKILPLTCFTEERVTQERKDLWTCRYREYLGESSALCKVEPKEERNMRFRELYKKYMLMLYDAADFDESPRNPLDLFNEVCAIYQIVYEYALLRNDVGKCGFAWKVAGRALCQLYALKCGGETVLCSFPVLANLFKKGRST